MVVNGLINAGRCVFIIVNSYMRVCNLEIRVTKSRNHRKFVFGPVMS